MSTPAPPPGVANNFVDPSTAMSLPIASSVITTTWQISGKLFAPLGDNIMIPVILAVIFGVALYAVSDSRGSTKKEKIPAVFTAFANTAILIASIMGITSATG